MKLFKVGKNVKIKILIWHMMGEMVKKWFNYGHFFSTVILPPFCCGKIDFKKICSGEMGNLLLLGGDTNLGENFA